MCVRNECVREYLQPARSHQFLEVNTVPTSRQVLRVLVSVFLVWPTAWSRVVRRFVGVYWTDAKNASVVVQVLRQFHTCKCGIEENDKVGVVKNRIAEKGVVYKAIHIVRPQ